MEPLSLEWRAFDTDTSAAAPPFPWEVSMERVQQRSDIQLRRDKELLRLEEVRPGGPAGPPSRSPWCVLNGGN